MSLRVFLDDIRPAPEGWTLVRWPHAAIALLETGNVEALSLDHDLGDDTITGNDVLTWLEEAVALRGFTPPASIAIHSANAVGRERMERAVASIRRYAEEDARDLSHRWVVALGSTGEQLGIVVAATYDEALGKACLVAAKAGTAEKLDVRRTRAPRK